jgi:hypothetical protein
MYSTLYIDEVGRRGECAKRVKKERLPGWLILMKRGNAMHRTPVTAKGRAKRRLYLESLIINY